MKVELPRLLIGGTHSGCGKTTVTSAVLQALVLRGLIPAAFKCGPDYIDPMFHSEVTGAPCRNLDLFLCGESAVRAQLIKNAMRAPVAIIEGVMGYYDGVGGTSVEASACDLANRTGTPSVLVVNVRGMSLSLAATVRGYLDFAKNTIGGVILNGVTKGMYAYYRDIVQSQTGVRVYGHLPEVPEASIASRHLGLITAAEIADLKHRLHVLAALAEDCIDLDGLLALAQSAPPLEYAHLPVQRVSDAPVRIAIARDRAFCFYYEDSLDTLRACGAELIAFSPLEAEALPAEIDGLYLGGGYPELYAAQLSGNAAMRASVRAAVLGGLPTLAECGGFLYLHQSIAQNGDAFPMAGVIDSTATMKSRLQNFGYATLTAQRDTLLCAAGASIRAHEFHYFASEDAGSAFEARKPRRAKAWPCVHATDTLFAGYPHLHFDANPAFAAAFVRRCAAYREERIKQC